MKFSLQAQRRLTIGIALSAAAVLGAAGSASATSNGLRVRVADVTTTTNTTTTLGQNGLPVVFDENGDAQTLIARIIRLTSFTIAADGRHARRSSCAENGQFHKRPSDK